MAADDLDAINRLDRAWDAAVRGRPLPGGGADDLTALARQMQATAADVAPDPAFVQRLGQALRRHPKEAPMSHTSRPVAPLASLPGLHPARVSSVEHDAKRQRPRAVVEAIAVLLLLATLGAAIGAGQLRPTNPQPGSSSLSGAALSASPAASTAPANQQIGANPVEFTIKVDADGILMGQPAAITDALSELSAALTTSGYAKEYGCPVALVETYAAGNSVGEGVALARAINRLLEQAFPDKFARATFQAIGLTNDARGTVVLQLYVMTCVAAAQVPRPETILVGYGAELTLPTDLVQALAEGDPAAVARARALLAPAHVPYPMCRVAVVYTYAAGGSVAEGVALARTINRLLPEIEPAVFAGAVFQSIADLDSPVGTIRFQMYFYAGCQPGPPGAATPAAAMPVGTPGGG